MTDLSLVKNLQNQSTWKLLGLGIITYGVYFAHYIQMQSKEINVAIGDNHRISSGFVNSIFIMSYASLVLFIAYMFVDEGHPMEALSNLIDVIIGTMLIVWSFKARNRVNAHCGLSSESDVWFHGFWTFIFTMLYFNYKVNCILEGDVEQAAPADS